MMNVPYSMCTIPIVIDICILISIIISYMHVRTHFILILCLPHRVSSISCLSYDYIEYLQKLYGDLELMSRDLIFGGHLLYMTWS